MCVHVHMGMCMLHVHVHVVRVQWALQYAVGMRAVPDDVEGIGVLLVLHEGVELLC